MIKVAVITRTKDRPLFLERAILSVQNQSFEDFIQVIYNDGGDKDSVDKLVARHRDIAKGKLKVVHAKKPSDSPDSVLNQAIKSVSSTYVAIHDDDDTWHEDFLRQAVAKLEETSAMGVVVRTDKVTERIVGDNIEKIKTEPWMPELKAINLYRQCIDNQMTPITFLYTREAYEKVGGYDESLPVLGDWDFGIRFLQKYDVEFLDPGFSLANYHHRPATGSSNDSVFGSGEERHRYWANRLMNKYLRQELAGGRLGVGYIMSRERYQQNYLSRLTHQVMPNFVARRLKKRVSS